MSSFIGDTSGKKYARAVYPVKNPIIENVKTYVTHSSKFILYITKYKINNQPELVRLVCLFLRFLFDLRFDFLVPPFRNDGNVKESCFFLLELEINALWFTKEGNFSSPGDTGENDGSFSI